VVTDAHAAGSGRGQGTGARDGAALGPDCLGYFFVLLDVTIVNVSLADMGVIRDG
jgi:hypothetical protein